MISLEQVHLLETKVAKAIEYLQRLSAENAALVSDKSGLMSKLEANQKRLDELEELVMRFKEDQGRIEDGILAALDRLSQFEESFESCLKEKDAAEAVPAKKSSAKKTAEKAPAPESEVSKEFFEITEPASDDELENELSLESTEADNDSSTEGSPEGELDIF